MLNITGQIVNAIQDGDKQVSVAAGNVGAGVSLVDGLA